MSRTRSDGGATVVRVDAITYRASEEYLPLRVEKGSLSRPPLAEFSSGRCGSQQLNGNACKYDRNPIVRGALHSSPNNSLKSSTKLIRTTTADPTRPTKNISSRSSNSKCGESHEKIVTAFRRQTSLNLPKCTADVHFAPMKLQPVMPAHSATFPVLNHPRRACQPFAEAQCIKLHPVCAGIQ